MAIKVTGSLSLSEIAAEYGDAIPYSLSEYYRGGGKVPNVSQNNTVPLSGAIAIGNFYGAVNQWTTYWSTAWNTSATTSQTTTTSWSTSWTSSWNASWTTSWTTQEGPVFDGYPNFTAYYTRPGAFTNTYIFWSNKGINLVLPGDYSSYSYNGWTYYPGDFQFSYYDIYYSIYRQALVSRTTSRTTSVQKSQTTSQSASTAWTTSWSTSQTTSKLTP